MSSAGGSRQRKLLWEQKGRAGKKRLGGVGVGGTCAKPFTSERGDGALTREMRLGN